MSLTLRRLGYGVAQLVTPREERRNRLDLLRTLFRWNYHVDALRLVEYGEEPNLGALAPTRVMER
jgi:hypothetical protein